MHEITFFPFQCSSFSCFFCFRGFMETMIIFFSNSYPPSLLHASHSLPLASFLRNQTTHSLPLASLLRDQTPWITPKPPRPMQCMLNFLFSPIGFLVRVVRKTIQNFRKHVLKTTSARDELVFEENYETSVKLGVILYCVTLFSVLAFEVSSIYYVIHVKGVPGNIVGSVLVVIGGIFVFYGASFDENQLVNSFQAAFIMPILIEGFKEPLYKDLKSHGVILPDDVKKNLEVNQWMPIVLGYILRYSSVLNIVTTRVPDPIQSVPQQQLPVPHEDLAPQAV